MQIFTNIQPGQTIEWVSSLPPLVQGENCCELHYLAQCGDETIEGSQEICVDAVFSSTDNLCADPYTLKCIPGFDPALNLSTQEAVDNHALWRQMHGATMNNYYDASPAVLISRPVTDFSTSRNGSYNVGRRSRQYVSNLVTMLRYTGDPFMLDRLCQYAKDIRDNLMGDWDGRGYPFIEYGADINSEHELSDTQWLEESLLQGTIGQMLLAFHANRGKSPECDFEADYWLAYLDEVHLPKWYNRTTGNLIHTSGTLPDGTSYNLTNTLNWNHPDPNNVITSNPDNQFWGAPLGNVPGYGNFALPHRVTLSHTFAAETIGMKAMCQCFTDLGGTPEGNPAKTTQQYCDEYNSMANAIIGQFPVTNGYRWVRHDFNGRSGSDLWNGLQVGNIGISGQNWWYFDETMSSIKELHHCGDSRFNEQVMQEFAGGIYGPNGLLIPGNTDNMYFNTDQTGSHPITGVGFYEWLPWVADYNGFKAVIDATTFSTTSHDLGGRTDKVAGDAYAACMMQSVRDAVNDPANQDKIFV